MQGCEINWKKGKNVTVKTIKKKQKHKSRGSVRTVTKSVQADSFFNFFSPPTMPDDPNSTLASDIQVLIYFLLYYEKKIFHIIIKCLFSSNKSQYIYIYINGSVRYKVWKIENDSFTSM